MSVSVHPHPLPLKDRRSQRLVPRKEGGEVPRGRRRAERALDVAHGCIVCADDHLLRGDHGGTQADAALRRVGWRRREAEEGGELFLDGGHVGSGARQRGHPHEEELRGGKAAAEPAEQVEAVEAAKDPKELPRGWARVEAQPVGLELGWRGAEQQERVGKERAAAPLDGGECALHAQLHAPALLPEGREEGPEREGEVEGVAQPDDEAERPSAGGGGERLDGARVAGRRLEDAGVALDGCHAARGDGRGLEGGVRGEGSRREGAPVVRAKVEPPQGLWHVRRLGADARGAAVR
mmetsp:Transcript_37536/g.122791  ORF Transcript_37536/g.122791 Transcript_37536/m.122791 type:complete len:294 (+) Transcript_37536:202-1083(+)